MMNTYQRQLFDDLTHLTKTNEAFYHVDHVKDGRTFRVFSYRLASYSNFLLPNALECRGHMFEIDGDGNAWRLASLALPKFFNHEENPFTMGLDYSQAEQVMLKMDGSLINTFMMEGRAHVKSKTSLHSQQAVDATKWLDANPSFRSELSNLCGLGVTVSMEYTAPDNRIVVGYAKPQLTILAVRSHVDGSFFERDELHEYPTLQSHWVETVKTDDVASLVASTKHAVGIEGYVVKLPTQFVKIKSDWYVSLHHTKSSINQPRRLFEVVLDEGADDLMSLLAGDDVAVALLIAAQEKISRLYNHVVATAEGYYNTNKHADRKTFAIGAQALTVDNLKLLGLVMSLYLGKQPDYKGFLKSRYGDLSLNLTTLEDTQ